MRRLRGRQARGRGVRGRGVRGRSGLPYDAIGALSPDFFVQFKYPVYAGQQVLFRDPECTSPVTDAGNHTIGGVKNPFTDEIVLTQANAAKRPLWGGESVGAIFDGIDDGLIGAGGGVGTDSVRTIFTHSIPDVSSNGTIIATRDDPNGWAVRQTEGYNYFTYHTTITASPTTTDGFTNGMPSLFMWSFDEVVGHNFRVDGVAKPGNSDTTPPAPSDDLFLGCFQGSREFYSGSISEAVLFKRALSPAEIEIVEAAL